MLGHKYWLLCSVLVEGRSRNWGKLWDTATVVCVGGQPASTCTNGFVNMGDGGDSDYKRGTLLTGKTRIFS